MRKLLGIFTLILVSAIGANIFAQGGSELQFQTNSLSQINKVEIFPNPSVDYLNVEILNSKMKKPVLELYSIIGNVVKVELDAIEENKYRLDVSRIPAGYYLLSIRDEQTQYKETFKFLKR